MKDFFRSMLSTSSDVSSMRLSFLFLVLVAAVVAVVGLVTRQNLYGVAALVAAILAPAFGGKSVQAFGEQPKGGAQ